MMEKNIDALKDIDPETLKKISDHVASMLIKHGIMPEDQAKAFAKAVIIDQETDINV